MSVNIVVPEVGESIVDARVAKWLKKEGDVVAAGEALVELETDKIDVEVSAPRAGVLEKIAHTNGADVKIGEVLGTIAEGSAAEPPKVAEAASVKAAAAKVPAEGATAEKEASAKTAEPARKTTNGSGGTSVPATPSARKAAREQDVDLKSVKADGPRVTKADVDSQALGARPSAQDRPAPAAKNPPSAQGQAPRAQLGERSETRERMSKRRATIAKRLVEAQSTAAMLTTFNEVDMSAVMALRERQKEDFKKKYGVGL